MSVPYEEVTQDGAWIRSVAVIAAIIVLALAAIAIAMVIASMNTFVTSKVDSSRLQMHEVDKRIQLYSLKNGIPATGNVLKAVYGDEKIPQDSWGRDIIFVSPGLDGKEYDLLSYGSDGAEGGTGTAEDIRLSAQ